MLDYVRFVVLTAVVIKIPIFWDITLCSPLKINLRFRGTCRLHAYLLHAALLIGLFFDSKDGVNMFFRNAVTFKG
jgi:hypothetical protein